MSPSRPLDPSKPPSTATGRQLYLDVLVGFEAQAARRALMPRLVGMLGTGALRPLWWKLNPHDIVSADLWGTRLFMRSNMRLPHLIAELPQFGEPLGLLVQAMPGKELALIDVGANIGDTVALVESFAPGKCWYLCVEPDEDFALFCELNTRNNPRVSIARALLSDRPGQVAELHHHLPGTAATRLSAEGAGRTDKPQLSTRTLDDVAASFAGARGRIDILKTDTDGYDFNVLRSAEGILKRDRPAVFFELHPTLWKAAGESPIDVFEYLHGLGYDSFVFFTNAGDFHALHETYSRPAFQALIDLSFARRQPSDFHYDVLCGPRDVCQEVARMSIENVRKRSQRR